MVVAHEHRFDARSVGKPEKELFGPVHRRHLSALDMRQMIGSSIAQPRRQSLGNARHGVRRLAARKLSEYLPCAVLRLAHRNDQRFKLIIII